MRIHARPAITRFDTGEVSAYAASVVGIAPHKTWYTEQHLGLVPTREAACEKVAEKITDDLTEAAIQHAVDQYGPAQAQQMMMAGKISIKMPDIPGVTTPGTWENPRFGNRDKHHKLYSLKTRTPEREREVIGEPERFQA